MKSIVEYGRRLWIIFLTVVLIATGVTFGTFFFVVDPGGTTIQIRQDDRLSLSVVSATFQPQQDANYIDLKVTLRIE